MSDKIKTQNETSAPLISDKPIVTPKKQEQEYEKLVEKSLEEHISDNPVSRQDITNPNLHYGLKEESEKIAAAEPYKVTPEEKTLSIKDPSTELKTKVGDEGSTLAKKAFNPSDAPTSTPHIVKQEVQETKSDGKTTNGAKETPNPDIIDTQTGPPPPPGPNTIPEVPTNISPPTPPIPGGGTPPTPVYDPDLVSTGKTVSEDAAAGTVIATLNLEGAAGTNFSYAITDQNGVVLGNSNFTILNNQIIVSPSANIDYETNQIHTFYVTGTDGLGNSVTEQLSITVTDYDEFDVSTITDTDTNTNAVDEDASTGSVVGITALATDADGTDTVTYSLSDDAGGLFTIDTNTGVVTVAGSLDAETATSHDITVVATSTDGSTSNQTFTINVNDVNETSISAISDTDASANSVAENVSVGTAVGITALATDADVTDTVTYSLSSNPGGFFAIDANTGVVTVANGLDFETNEDHTIEVTATSDDGSTSTQSFTINVTDVDEFDVSAITDTDATANSVAENASLGTSVGVTAFASDADGSNNGITYSLSDDAGGLFAIDPNTGEVTVAGAIDYETATSQTIEVTATSDDGSTSTQSFTINVTDVDEFDVSAITDTDATANSVAENASLGTSVGVTAFASDADGSNNGITYSLSDDAGGLFAIDPNTGEVTVAGAIDYETATSQTIEVTATSDDGSTSTQSFTINVTDVDEFDVSAITDTNTDANAVDEDASTGSVVGITALATDADGTDTVTYSLSDDAGGLFTIDTNTGVVTVAGSLDAETATSHDITVVATSTDGSTSNQTFTINVNDVNETSISAISDTDASANSVAENVSVGTAVGITALATDADVTDTVTYSLSSNPGGFFAIDANTGVVTVANGLDFETNEDHTIEVTATSDDGSTSTQSFTINVTDVDEFDVSAITDTDATANSVAENASLGTSVGVTAFASDADGSNNGITYSLSDDAGGLFAIDPNTGEVTVAGAIDYETATSQTIEVTATSDDGSTSTQSFTINVTDVDEFDVSAITDTDATANSVAENASLGTSVGVTAFASDADGSNNGITYSLSDDAGGLFAIDPNTGEVTVAGAIDYETATSQTIEVTATSDDGSTSTQSFTINVTDVDEFDVSAITDTNTDANAVDEDASTGSVVGITALATDADGTDTVTYSLSDDAGGLFTIDTNTGVVTVAGSLDAETATSHDITVVATSTDGSTSNQTFTINVNDVNETSISAISDTDASANSVAENVSVGTAVGITALATDADVTDTVTYSLSSNPGGFFAIDANTGVVTVANGLDFETNEDHTIEVTATSDDGSTSTQSFTINVTDVDEFDVSAITDTDATANSVAENASLGTSVGVTAFASDADGSNNGITYSLSDDAGGLFAIDPNTGEVTVAGAIDYETATSQTIEVTATSDDGSTSTQSFTINVTDVDEFDVSAITDTDATANSVAENASLGTSVGVTAFASDADGSNNGITYSLSDDAGGLFAIDPNTGEVTVAGAIDYETATSQTIEVTATSDDGSTSTQSFTINVTDVDEFDVSAITDTNTDANAVDEDASTGSVVGITALATDADGTDTVTYSLSDDAGGLFAIDPNTGEVTVAGAIDYETATSQTIEVTATSDDGSTSTQSFTININDANENPTDIQFETTDIREDANRNDGIGEIEITISDPDGDTNFTFTVSDSRFEVYEDGGSYFLQVKNGVTLDYETEQTIDLTITATDQGGLSYNENVTLDVIDVNEAPDAQTVDLGTTNEDTSILITEAQLLANSSDVDAGATLSITSLTLQDNANGSLIDNGNGTWTFNPTGDLSANDVTFNFTVSDGTLTDSSTATLDVTAVADSPSLTLSTTNQDIITGSTSLESGFEGGVFEGFTSGSEWIGSIGGWNTDSDSIEVKTETLGDGSTNQFIELNNDAIDFYEDATNIYQEIDTTDGGTYTVDFNFAPRPGFDATINQIEVLVDGVVVKTISADGTSDGSINWQSDSITFTGDGTPARIEFREAGVDQNYGRGMYMDNIEITEDLPAGHANGMENTAIALPDITASTTDTDGSETLALTITNIPDGAVLTDGTNTFTATSGDTDVDISSWQLDNISITPPDEFSGDITLTVNATATDGSDQNTVSSDISITVHDDDDTFTGTATEDLYNGGAGDDIINGNGGNDWLVGGEGEDTINGGFGDDIITGGAGDDEIDGGDGADTAVFSGNYADYDIAVNADGDYLITDLRTDSPDGTDLVSNVESFQFADQTVAVGDMTPTTTFSLSEFRSIDGGIQTVDDRSTETTDQNIQGTDSNELLIGGSGDDTINAGGGDDNADGRTGKDTISGGDGDDILVGGVGRDTISGDGGNDAIDGGKGKDTALYSGNLADYTITTQDDGSFRITDNRAGSPDGTDVVTNVEFFEFADGTYTNSELSSSDTDATANTVVENASIGTTVGITSSAPGDVTYSLTDDAGGLFTIDANTGVVTVAGDLDYETATSHTIEVTATQSDGTTLGRTYEIDVTNVNEAPTDLTFTGNNQFNANGVKIASGSVVADVKSVTDVDAADTHTYALTDDASGKFTIDTNTGEIKLAANHDASSGYSDTVTVQVTDGGGNTYSETIQIDLGTNGDDIITGSSGNDIIYGLGSNSGLLTTNLINNGSFENYSGNNGSGSGFEYYTNVNGWSTSGTTYDDFQLYDAGAWSVSGATGSKYMDMENDGNSTITQNVTGLTAGTTYELSFDAAQMSSFDGTLQVYWGGQLIDTVDVNSNTMTTYTYEVEGGAGDGSNSLSFTETGSSDNGGTALDNVQLYEVLNSGDTLNGGGGDDAIYGGAGNDTLNGGTGDDTLKGGLGADSLDGGTGNDTAIYSGSDSAVTVNLGTGSASGGHATGDTFTSVENITGSDHNDSLTGDSNDNVLTGGAGNDNLVGGDGSDLFIFNEGHGTDTIDGGSGASWTDTIELHDSAGGSNIGTYGTDWTLTLKQGSIDSVNADSIDLSDDADGTINLQDGSSIDFTDIERIDW